jgi:hypothetical protein
MKTTFISLALLLACAGCDNSADPAPAAGVMALRLTNSSSLLGASASACLRDTPLRTSEAGTMLWSTPALATSTVALGPVARGKRLYLSVQYNDVNQPGYLWPSGTEHVQADLLMDGKLVGSVMLNAQSFSDPTNYFSVDATRMNLVRELEVLP